MLDPLKTPPPVDVPIERATLDKPSKIQIIPLAIWALVIISSISLVYLINRQHKEKLLQMEAQDTCAPAELFDIAIIGEQHYAVCEAMDGVKYDLKPF